MLRINNSDGKPNWSQRMNPDDPSTPWNETLETCNVTAAITAMETAGWDTAKLNEGLHPRSPMDLLLFMRKDLDCNVLYNRIDPTHSSPMNEWNDVLAMAIGKYLGLPPIRANYSVTKETILDNIMNGLGIVIRGMFTFVRKDGTTVQGGHFESLAGINYQYRWTEMGTISDEKPAIGGFAIEVDTWIVDDPWGNPNTNYFVTAGNDIPMKDSDFMRQISPPGSLLKDAIFIPKAAADGISLLK